MPPSSAAGGSGTKAPARERKTRPAAAGVQPKPKARQPEKQTAVVKRGAPHDVSRLGLPLGTLLAVPVVGGGVPDGALLAAAALLLFAAAAGGLVVGIFGRRLLRTA